MKFSAVMVSLRLKNRPCQCQLLIIFIVSNFNMGNLWYGAEARFIKYTQGPIPSSQSGRRYFGGTTIGTASKVTLDYGIDSTNSGLGTSVSSGAVSVTPESPSYNTAEVVGPKSSSLNTQEPTCEELRAMWIFSKRQSRAVEITNELPAYRDPFGFKLWKPYYAVTRNIFGSVRMIPWIRERSPSPVFGRVISREPVIQPRLFSYRGQYFGSDIISSPRLYGAEEKSTFNNHNGYGSRNMNGFHRPSKYRYEGTNGSTANEGNEAISNLFKVHGSFQRLKELIWTERAKELKQQRKSEELAVRASVLKEIASGRRSKSPYQHSLVSESSFLDENRNPEGNIYKHLNDGHKLTNRGQSYFIEEYDNKHKNIKISGSSSKKKKFDNKILLHSSKSHYDSSRKATNNSTYNKLRKIFSNLRGITRALKLCNYMSKNLYRKHTESCLESFSQFYFPNGGSDTITKANNFIKYDFVPGTFYIRERNSALFEGNSTFEKRKHAISSSQEVRRHSQMADKAWQEKRMPERTFQKFNWYTFAPAINSETKDYYKIMKRHMEVESNSSLANTSVERLGIFDFSTNESGTYPSKTSTMSE